MVGMYGNTFSKVEEAGVTTQVWGFRPASCALSPLTLLAAAPNGAPVGFKALHASTMLKAGSKRVPAIASEMSVGIVGTATSPTVTRRPS